MPDSDRRRTVVAALTAALAVTSVGTAQEATNTPAATQPAAGSFYLRQTFSWTRYDSSPTGSFDVLDQVAARTTLTYGVTRDISVRAELPIAWESARGGFAPEDDVGVEDISLLAKWRPIQIDLGPVDSVRLAFYGGIEVPTMDSGFSSESWDPFVGTVFTAILGRHGINQSLAWKFNTSDERLVARPDDGPDDALRFDTAYLFRLSPETYASDTVAATYLTAELNGVYETNGDVEAILSAGLLYEARSFALEATFGLPVISRVDDRAERELVLTLGFRILF